MDNKKLQNNIVHVKPEHRLVLCKLCEGTGVCKTYICIRCGGYGTFHTIFSHQLLEEIPANPSTLTKEELKKLMVLRLNGPPKKNL